MTDLHEQIHDKINHDIRERGQSLMGVMGDPPFIYTIGMHHRKLPELLVLGTAAMSVMGAVLNALCDVMREEGPFKDGAEIDLGGAYPLSVVEAEHPDVYDEYCVQAVVHYGHRKFRVLQLVVPDVGGKFPWDKDVLDSFIVPILRRSH